MHTEFWLESLKGSLRGLMHVWEDNIKVGLKDTGWEGVDRLLVTNGGLV
jgi:hypothetical protein